MSCDSLLRLFRSDFFDAHLHMYYLYRMEHAGIQDYLVNEIYRMTDEDIDFHLPQLCQMAVARYNQSSLKKFLADKSAQSAHFALRARWLLLSIAEDKQPELTEHALAIMEMCQAAVVDASNFSHILSGNSPSSSSGKSANHAEKTSRLSRRGSDPGMQQARKEGPSHQGRGVVRHSSMPVLPKWRKPRRSQSAPVRWSAPHIYPSELRPTDLESEVAESLSTRTVTTQPSSRWNVALRHVAAISQATLGEKMAVIGHPLFPSAYSQLGEPAATVRLIDDQDADSDAKAPQALKQKRSSDYFTLQNHLAALIMRLSNSLVVFTEKPERYACLCNAFALLNRWLLDRRVFMAFDRSNELGLLGLHLPVQGTRDSRHQILHVHVDECKIFSSATRCPFVMIYETANLDEADVHRCALETLAGCVAEELNAAGINIESSQDDVDHCRERVLWETLLAITPKQWRRMPAEAPRKKRKGREESDAKQQKNETNAKQDSSHPAAAGESVGGIRPRRADKWREVASKVRMAVWGEPWSEKEARIRKHSLYGNYASWALNAVMVKGGDDVRQELLGSQIIDQFSAIFSEVGLPLWLKPIRVVVVGSQSGFIEFIRDATSVDAMKKHFPGKSMAEIFKVAFADKPFEAKKNFIQSCAAYSLVIWFLQVKDRHNGNIMLDSSGHAIHIDFGYMLSNSPGGNFGFEQSPFKLTQEFLDVMGGATSVQFGYFRMLIIRGFLEARRHMERIILPIKMMLKGSKLPCFRDGPDQVIQDLHERFFVNLTEEACVEKIVDLIETSVNNWRTIQYDNYQRIVNGIL